MFLKSYRDSNYSNSLRNIPSLGVLEDLGTTPKLLIMSCPEGPSSQYLRTLVPNTIESMVLEPETPNIGYLDPLGCGRCLTCAVEEQKRMNYVTPTNYLELVQGYMGMLKAASDSFSLGP